MAKRPVFYLNKNNDVKEKLIEFKWFSGFAVSQKQKSIQSLHTDIAKEFNTNLDAILEISTKSENTIGKNLSAFNLQLNYHNYSLPVENYFQASKVFEEGGPYEELLKLTPHQIKKDTKIKASGKLMGFNLLGEEWPLTPKTMFYDWIYIHAVYQNPQLHKNIIKYNYFTDIEFNPKKSLNCQAKAAALYVSLYRNNELEKVIKNRNYYQSLIMKSSNYQTSLF